MMLAAILILHDSYFQSLSIRAPTCVLACQPQSQTYNVPHLLSFATVSIIISAVRTAPLVISSVHLLLFYQSSLPTFIV